MDRRQQKSRKAIFEAFSRLLERKRYDHITVQEIIDEANVGRSTFYAHFETKDMLLKALCDRMFHAIFDQDPCPWIGRDQTLEGKLAHILWHLRQSRRDILGVLTSDSAELFMEYLRQHLADVFRQHLDQFCREVPEDFLLHQLVGGFAEAVRWWLREGMKTEPEAVAAYYLNTRK